MERCFHRPRRKGRAWLPPVLRNFELMFHLIFPSFLIIVCLLLGCSKTEGNLSPNPAPVAATQTPAHSPAPEKIDQTLQIELRKVASAANGRVGVGAVFLETGDSAYLDRQGRYPMQSVYKLPIAMAVLKVVDDGKARIDQEVRITPNDLVRQGLHSPIRDANPQGTSLLLSEVLRFSVSESDGTASDVLLDLAGGPEAVMAYLEAIGVKELIVADSEKSISKDWETQYRNWSTPGASVELLRALFQRRAKLSEQATQVLLNLMIETETGARRIKHGLPEGAMVAHKTGTGGTVKGITGATNDIGIITLPDGRHVLLAVYISDSPAHLDVREKVIAEIARTVIAKWSPGVYAKESAVNGADFNTRHTLQ